MKPILKYLIYTLFAVVILESCEDNRMENMASDKIYLLKSGLQQVPMFNLGTWEYDLPITKSGYGNKAAELEFLTEPSLLSDYNIANGTSYKLLPLNCYSVESSSINIAAEKAIGKNIITFNTTEILKIQENGDLYLLPLQIKAINNIELKDSITSILLVPDITESYISFATPGFPSSPFTILLSDSDQFKVSVKVQTNYINSWDLTGTVVVDPQALTDYNTVIGSSYQQLPGNAFILNPASYSLAAGVSSTVIPVTIVKKNLVNAQGINLFGEYVLPLRIKTVSKFGIDPVNGLQFFHVNYMPDLLSRIGWEVIDYNSCIVDEPQYSWIPRAPATLLDNEELTFWSSLWDSPTPLPYFFVIDMKSSKNVYKVGFTKPAQVWRGNEKKGYFEISNDLSTWTKLVDWELTNNDPRSHEFNVVVKKGRYLRMVITEAFGYMNTGNPASGAQMDMSEIRVWGLNE